MGAGGEPTVTVTDCCALPPAPEQERVKVFVAVSAPVETEPLVACAPLQPPEAVQLVAFVELHVRVDAAPYAIVVGLAEIDTVGICAEPTVTVTDWDALPPAPEQVSV